MLTNVITIDPVASGGYKEWVSTLLWKIIHNICESLEKYELENAHVQGLFKFVNRIRALCNFQSEK